MKKFRFLILSIMSLGLIFSSCSSDEKAAEKEEGVNGKATYAGVSIILPENSRYTRSNEDPNAGIAAEKAIKDVGIYIIDVNSGRFDYMVVENSTTNFEESTNAQNQKVYKANVALKTVTGMKKLFVVANPTAALQSALEAKTGASMSSVAFGLPSTDFIDATGTTLNSMVMSGAYVLTNGEYDLTEVKDEAAAIANPAKVTISRNLAKIVVQKASDYKVADGSSVKLTWDIINKAKDSYLLIQDAGTLYKSIPTGAENNSNDPYWSNFLGMTGTDYIGVLEYGSGDNKNAEYNESRYVFENIPEKFYSGNTTAARIKGVYKPAKIFKDVVNGTPELDGSYTEGTDFYRSKIEGSYWTLAGRNAAISAKYNGHAVEADFIHYPNAVGYYTFWVNDGSDKGVKRNNYYLLQIREIRGPGSPEEGVDPEKPVAEDTHLGVEVTVMNWGYNKAVEDLQ